MAIKDMFRSILGSARHGSHDGRARTVTKLVLRDAAASTYTGLLDLIAKLDDAPIRVSGAADALPIRPADISQLNQADKMFSDTGNGAICYDLSTEALQFKPLDCYLSQQFEGFHRLLSEQVAGPSMVFFLNANSESGGAYDWWRARLGIDVPVRLLGYNFYLGAFWADVIKHYREHDLFGITLDTSAQTVHAGRRRARRYTCLNHRPRSHRYAVLLFLIHHGLLEEGFVSFAGDELGRVDAPTVVDLEESLAFVRCLPEGEGLAGEIDRLAAMCPLVLDRTPDDIRDHLWGKPAGGVAQSLGQAAQPLAMPEMFDSYFEIVTETWFTDHSCRYVTEKTLRPITGLRPFIHVGTPYVLRWLRTLGFETFHPLIREDYDDIADPLRRMGMILQEIERLCRMPPDDLHALYCALWPRLTHNYFHFFKNGGALIYDELDRYVACPIIRELHGQR